MIFSAQLMELCKHICGGDADVPIKNLYSSSLVTFDAVKRENDANKKELDMVRADLEHLKTAVKIYLDKLGGETTFSSRAWTVDCSPMIGEDEGNSLQYLEEVFKSQQQKQQKQRPLGMGLSLPGLALTTFDFE
jgi:hypothetical protein